MIPINFSKKITLADLHNQCVENNIDVIASNGKWYLDFEIKQKGD